MTRKSATLVSLAPLLIAAFANSCGRPGETPTPDPVSFTSEIKPLLQEKCLTCHNTGLLLGELNLENRDLAFGRSERGEFIVPGKPNDSLLYTMTLATHGTRDPEAGAEKPMPLQAPDLSPEERGLLKRWIEEGADWPEGADGHIKVLMAPDTIVPDGTGNS